MESRKYLRKEYEDPWNLLTIDLDALESNYRSIKSRLPESSALFAVVKSDAYGHGIKEVTRTLSSTGCRHFAVETPHEGIVLRNEGIEGEILVMNPVPEWMSELCVKHDLSVTVISITILQSLEETCEKLGKKAFIHLNANVGLNRMGISASRILKIARYADQSPYIEIKGLYGQPRTSSNAVQAYEKLQAIDAKMVEHGLRTGRFHFANSTCFLDHPETVAGGVRIGILLYGVLPPEQSNAATDLDITPIMTVSSQIVQLRTLPAGSRIGYRSRSKTERETTIATIPMGYYHGLDRKLSGLGHVLVRGKRARYIGTLSMNSSTVDVTAIPGVAIGDKVTIIGKQQKEDIFLQEHAAISGSIAAELMVRFGQGGTARRYLDTRGDLPASSSYTVTASGTVLHYLQTEKDFPEWLTTIDVVDFLHSNMDEYAEPETVIMNAIDYSLSSIPQGNGFLILASRDEKILGAVLNARTETVGFIPENILVYVCVHRDHRQKGIARAMIEEAVRMSGGDIKLHVEKNNPAIEMYKKLGFGSDYLEMRFNKNGERS